MSRLVAVLLSLVTVIVNGQPNLFVTINFRNFINYDVNVATSILNSFTAMNNLACIYACSYNSNCSLVVFKSSGNVCNVYSSSAFLQVITTSSSCTLYQKQISGYFYFHLILTFFLNNQKIFIYFSSSYSTLTVSNYALSSLIWYWPIISSSLNDYVSAQNLVAYGSPSFMADRFGNSNGALKRTTTSSYWMAPAGVYFSGDFTITGWVYLASSVATEMRNCYCF
jgi:hypothetical protein